MKLFAAVYIVIAALTAFSNAQAQNTTTTTTTADPNLPAFQFLLTQESEPQREQLCLLNMGFCETNCGGPNKAPMNFCNSTTMGWGCGCIDKVPDLLGYEWPINREHCIGSGQACTAACQDPKVPNEQKQSCNEACSSTYTQKCGTPAQPPAYYNVPDIATIPTYAPPNLTNNVNNSTSTNGTTTNGTTTNGTQSTNNTASEGKKQSSASSINHFGNAAAALIIVASGMSLL
ncbi:hypothetical protein RclHR1_02300010 [Rhizophagus clarus]|uniref:DUF7707 domain-containing protein n=1 Tax=Rhizophagus clarus TaxID=94130 RepID=A0A2Z6R8U1_9GLOM|nr:hypothetical protein RclHR1_02300010 [Rhizophagus clarus]GES78880.1 hypothetical protein GLOIN_2v1555171 [Rhizophagus clarus]